MLIGGRALWETVTSVGVQSGLRGSTPPSTSSSMSRPAIPRPSYLRLARHAHYLTFTSDDVTGAEFKCAAQSRRSSI